MEINELSVDDLSFLNEVRNECCEEYLHDSTKFTLEQTIEWFKNTSPMFWIIKINDERVGYFRTSNYSAVSKNIYIGADLHKNYRDKGIGFQAYCLFIPLIFKKLSLHKVTLEVIETNLRAINLYRKLGFKTEGVRVNAVRKGDKYVNSIIMSLLENECQCPH